MAVDRASEEDRAWFLDHPAESAYIRGFIPGEAGDIDDAAYNAMLVRQIAPGVRTRQAWHVLPPIGLMTGLLWPDGEIYPVDPMTGAVRGLPDDELTARVRRNVEQGEAR